MSLETNLPMREKPIISEFHLRNCLHDCYDLDVVSLDFLPLGLDSRAATFRVREHGGRTYFLKAKASPLYQPALFVPRYLYDQGIGSVVAPILTNAQILSSNIEGWTVIVYPFIDGGTDWASMNAEHWKQVGVILQHVHQFTAHSLHAESIRTEAFDAHSYTRWIHAFEAQHIGGNDGSPTERAFRAAWLEHQPTIHQLEATLEKLAVGLQAKSLPHVICHADLHPGNLLRDHSGHVFVIDWDDVMLAPRERDFIFVPELPATPPPRLDQVPFFQGYGPIVPDREALAYYRHERIIQDLIASAEEVFFRDDLGTESKTAAIQLFRDVLTGSDAFLG